MAGSFGHDFGSIKLGAPGLAAWHAPSFYRVEHTEKIRSAPKKGRQHMGEIGFCTICGFLRFPLKLCSFLRKSATPKLGTGKGTWTFGTWTISRSPRSPILPAGYPILPAGYPDENVYVPWVPHTTHKLLTPGYRSGDPWPPGRETPGHPGSHRKNMFMFMCLFLSWQTLWFPESVGQERADRGNFSEQSLGWILPGDFWVDFFGALFPWKKQEKKNPPRNPWQNSNQNLGASRSKATLQGSGLDSWVTRLGRISLWMFWQILIYIWKEILFVWVSRAVFRVRQRSGEGVVRRNGCPKGCFSRVRFFSAPLRFRP